jgi:hypothetical protein
MAMPEAQESAENKYLGHRMLLWKKITTRKNCFRYLNLISPLNAAICTTISYTLWVEWYYIKTIIWPWSQRSHEGHYGTRHTALWSCTHIPNIIDLSRDKNVMARTRKYYLKNNYLILRSKIKVPRRSLRYTTHLLMVMHIRTIFQWTILLNLFEFRSKVKVPWRLLRYATHRLMVMHPHTNYHWPISKDKNGMARTRKYN